MMFGIIPVPIPDRYAKRYVIAAIFHKGDWFLRDALSDNGLITRVWTSNFAKALVFSSEADAETIGDLVLGEDDFVIESVSVRPR